MGVWYSTWATGRKAMAWAVYLYDFFFTDGNDLFPKENFTRKEAEAKLFEEYGDSKLELIVEEKTVLVPRGKYGNSLETLKEEYYVMYPSEFVEGAFLKIEKKRESISGNFRRSDCTEAGLLSVDTGIY